MAILNMLREESRPVTGMELSARFGVSRQVIVQDVAILRASGEQVLATPSGYLIPEVQQESWTRAVVACRHNKEQIEDELLIIVDGGARALDVIVEHPVYGELRCNLMIASRRDLFHFIDKLQETEALPLSALTDGIHLHTIEAPDRHILEDVVNKLERAGYLVR